MGLAYTPPGVYVSEVVSPSVNPLLAAPANVCIVGPAQGYIQQTDYISLVGEDNVKIPNLPQNATLQEPLVSVRNINGDVNYVENTDYVVNYSTSVNEVQVVTVLGAPSGGTFTLTFQEETTTPLPYNATVAAVEAALEVLFALEPADITVTGTPGNYTVTFAGQYVDEDVQAIEADDNLTGGSNPSVDVTTPTEGGVTGTIRRVPSGGIPDNPIGETVIVTYRFVPENYYGATRLDQPASVENYYGPAFNQDGTISSYVTFAAQCAFENGARDVIIAPLFRRSTDANPLSTRMPPSKSAIQSATTWAQTLYGLRDLEDINVIVPAIGQSFPGLNDSEQQAIFAAVQDHLKYMADQQQYVVAILGEDSSVSTARATRDTIHAHAQALASRFGGQLNEQTVLLNTSKFGRFNPVTSLKHYVGGQYVAAAIAGMLAGRSVSASVTREVVSGFTNVVEIPPRSKTDKNVDAQLGLLVVEQRGTVVQIRHAVTLDTSSTARRELTVVRGKHRMIESIRDTLETQIIGKVIADGNAPLVVSGAVSGVLEALKVVGDLVDYRDVQARTLTLDPTTVEVRFSYKPSFPLNYVNIIFSIDLTTAGSAVAFEEV